MTIRIHFWGTRGSLPVALSTTAVQEKIVQSLLAANGRHFDDELAVRQFIQGLPFATSSTYGGNTSCVELDAGDSEYLLCDLGTGARPFGNYVLAKHGPAHGNTFHIFLSHVHWDHIMGFPFFAPAYIPGNRIILYGCQADIEQAFRLQHAAPCFPVDYSQLQAQIEFVLLEPDRHYTIAGYDVLAKHQLHGGDSYGFRFERDGKAVVYSTDSEHRLQDMEATQDFVAFFDRADLVVFDAMYSLADAVSVREDWGHSSNIVGVELCQMARVKHLCLFHHEPVYSDGRIEQVLQETRRFEEITRDGAPALTISSAYDGLDIIL